MYQIIKDGAVLGMTEAPNYIARSENGCFVLCPEADATGIAYNGTPYHLMGMPELEGVEETVVLASVDGGGALLETERAQMDTDELNVDHEYRLTLMELGVTDA